jgi:hypothetical protein
MRGRGQMNATRLVLIVAAWLAEGAILSGCQRPHYIVASSATVIGVEVSQNPASQLPQAKLGYNRAETAVIPTNRDLRPEAETPKGADEAPDVLMELRYDGIFALSDNSGIYQRLAVGKNAVGQPGAAAMFLRDAAGKIDENALKAAQALSAIPSIPPDTVRNVKDYSERFNSGDQALQSRYNMAATCVGGTYSDFATLAQDPNATSGTWELFKRKLSDLESTGKCTRG